MTAATIGTRPGQAVSDTSILRASQRGSLIET